MNKWTYNNIPDHAGRIAVVTGGTSGIGFEVSRMLATKGAKVIMTYRDTNQMEQAMDRIIAERPNTKPEAVKIELDDLESVNKCANYIKKRYNRLDLLINNAGIMVPPFGKTKQGYELQFGINHLGHFALTGQLLPLLLQTKDARIVSVSSLAAFIGKIHFDDLNYEIRRYNEWEAYGQSKLANLLFIQMLSKKLAEHKIRTVALAAHPGGSPTNLQRTSSYFMKKILTPLISHTPAQAALPTLRAACDPDAQNGTYWGPSSIVGLTGHPGKARLPRKALDLKIAGELWELSEKLTGVVFDFKYFTN